MNTNVLILSTNYWHSLRFRKQRFAEMFAAAGRKVAYVNPLFTILSFIEDHECRQIFWDGLRSTRNETQNLWVATQPPVLPFRRKNRLVNRVDMGISRHLLARLVDQLWGRERYIQIVYSPEDVLRLRPTTACVGVHYECVDEHAAYPWNAHRRAYVEELEQTLLREADLVTFTARGLWEAKKGFCKRSAVVPNGVDLGRFQVTSTEPPVFLPGLTDAKGPIILYVGAIMEWFDWSLLRACAQKRPDWQFVLAGPTNLPAERYQELPNIHYLGTCPPEHVPHLIRHAKVCLIPFLVNELTVNVSPLKLYEYLAVGKPVVSVPLPEVLAAEDPSSVVIAGTSDGFVDAIGQFLECGHDTSACLRMAERHSWDGLFSQLNGRLVDAGLL